MCIFYPWSRDSSGGIATVWVTNELGFYSWQGKESILSSPYRPDRFCSLQSLLPKNTEGAFHGGKAARTDHSLLSSAEVKNTWYLYIHYLKPLHGVMLN
jgi:hypothetical protein